MVTEGTGAIETGIPRLAVEESLAAYGDTGDDLMMALARKLVSGEIDDAEVEDIFQQGQQVAAEADHLLVDGDWELAEPAPASVAVLPSGGRERSVELVPCAGHHGSSEQQQSPFSWAEFLADQPDEPKPGGRNARPSGPSLFDWALELEQEAVLAAAGG